MLQNTSVILLTATGSFINTSWQCTTVPYDPVPMICCGSYRAGTRKFGNSGVVLNSYKESISCSKGKGTGISGDDDVVVVVACVACVACVGGGGGEGDNNCAEGGEGEGKGAASS